MQVQVGGKGGLISHFRNKAAGDMLIWDSENTKQINENQLSTA